MLWIVIATLAALGIIGCLVVSRVFKKKKQIAQTQTEKSDYTVISNGSMVVAGIFGIVVVLTTIFCSIYTQDPGQASVLVSFTGNVQSINYESGLHVKAPWTHRVEYDIRNNTLSYTGPEGQVKQDYTGGNVSGPQITFQDANGVSGNIDINIRYSVRGNAVGNIYNEYKTQQEFVSAVLAPEVRAKTREILSRYETSQVYSNRDAIKGVLVEALQKSWDSVGVDVEDVYLQEVRYPDSVVNAFAKAQAARAEVETAKADQEKAKVEADTNRIKSQAIDNKILMEELVQAIKSSNGNTFIIGDEMLSIGVK